MKIIEHPSPNFDSRDGHAIDMLVLHYTGMQTAAGALEKLCNPNTDRKVSAHYMVDEDGTIYALVPEEKRAWHAGVSYWRGHTNINQRSIGIEIVNPGHEYGYRSFPEIQMISVAELCKQILSRHAITARNVVGHSDIAPERKEDPGELFDWKFLAGQNIGLWPTERYLPQTPSMPVLGWGEFMFNTMMDILYSFRKRTPAEKIALGALPSPEQVKAQLSNYGYDCTNLPKTILAFQRHFTPKRLTGQWDRECALILDSLLDLAG